jgi:hypothetical protein
MTLDTAIGALVGTMGTGAIGLALIAFGRSMFSKWLENSAARELEGLRKDYAKEVGRDLLADTSDFQHRLEAFKSHLMLAAEVRRVVAAKKVAALEEILNVPMLTHVAYGADNTPEQRRQAIDTMIQHVSVTTRSEHLFEARVALEFHEYRKVLVAQREALSGSYPKNDSDAFHSAYEAVETAHRRFLQLVRSEFGVEPLPDTFFSGAGSRPT